MKLATVGNFNVGHMTLYCSNAGLSRKFYGHDVVFVTTKLKSVLRIKKFRLITLFLYINITKGSRTLELPSILLMEVKKGQAKMREFMQGNPSHLASRPHILFAVFLYTNNIPTVERSKLATLEKSIFRGLTVLIWFDFTG